MNRVIIGTTIATLVTLAACSASDEAETATTVSATAAPATTTGASATTEPATTTPAATIPPTTVDPLDKPVNFGAGERLEMAATFVQGSGGALLQTEAECWVDVLIASNVTERELDRLATNPTAVGPLASEFGACLDPEADIDAPLSGELRQGTIDGMTSQGFDEAVATCTIDYVAEQGIDARDLLVAGLNQDVDGVLASAFSAGMAACSTPPTTADS